MKLTGAALVMQLSSLEITGLCSCGCCCITDIRIFCRGEEATYIVSLIVLESLRYEMIQLRGVSMSTAMQVIMACKRTGLAPEGVDVVEETSIGYEEIGLR